MIEHIPVLLNDVVESFLSLKNRSGLTYFDGTFGRGGHLRAVAERCVPNRILACDQDQQAVEFARKNFPEVEISHQNFLEFAHSNRVPLDLILLDLGVSSPQLDHADRGFSFNKDGPLDMRMNQSTALPAAHIIKTYDEQDLISLFREYGEIEKPQRVVRAICKDRAIKDFSSTLELAGLIERVDGWQKKGFHPATQYFMALRLVVNRELQVVEEAVPLLIDQLTDGGRISIITFHSLEDRLVKNIFKNETRGFLVQKKVIVPSDEECKINPRARSAKLRVFQKGSPPEKVDKFAARRALLNK